MYKYQSQALDTSESVPATAADKKPATKKGRISSYPATVAETERGIRVAGSKNYRRMDSFNITTVSQCPSP